MNKKEKTIVIDNPDVFPKFHCSSESNILDRSKIVIKINDNEKRYALVQTKEQISCTLFIDLPQELKDISIEEFEEMAESESLGKIFASEIMDYLHGKLPAPRQLKESTINYYLRQFHLTYLKTDKSPKESFRSVIKGLIAMGIFPSEFSHKLITYIKDNSTIPKILRYLPT